MSECEPALADRSQQGVHGLRRMVEVQLPTQEKAALARYLEELKLLTAHHRQLETELARLAESDRDALLLSITGLEARTTHDVYMRMREVRTWINVDYLIYRSLSTRLREVN